MNRRYGPTPRADWCEVGDRVEGLPGGMQGLVKRIVTGHTIPQVTVDWDSGSTGRHTITTLRKVTP